MNLFYPAVAQRAGHRCEYCHAPEVVFNFPFEVEHIIPVSVGGTDNQTNLALACRSCNLRKAAHTTGLDPSSQTIIRLFNPPSDLWNEHFEVDLETGIMAGLSDLGRATIARLEINSNAQVLARRQWMRLGLFP